MNKINLIEDPHVESNFYRLPTEQGTPSVFVLEGEWYQASATDESGAEYIVYWDICSDWNRQDESDACNWESPRAIILYPEQGNARDVTALVSL